MSGRLGPIANLSDALRSKLGPKRHHQIRQRLLPIYSRLPRIHWSQSGEDIILGELLPEKQGTYVDVGAAHPRLGSNTYFLYRRGWRGTLIEPNPKTAQELRKARPRDRVIEAAAGSSTGTARFTIFQSNYLSSIDSVVTEDRTTAGEAIESVLEVPVVTLADLKVCYGSSQPCLLSIDCEGSDLDVLLGNDWNSFTPRVVCVEELSTTIHQPTAIRKLLENESYQLFAHTGLSAIYVHSD